MLAGEGDASEGGSDYVQDQPFELALGVLAGQLGYQVVLEAEPLVAPVLHQVVN